MVDVQQAINIDEHHAVLVRNEDVGTLEQYTDQGLFVPGPYQQILEIQEKIVLQEFERMAYKDETGKLIFISGDSEMRNFFIPPFCEKVTQDWSIDLRKEHAQTRSIWKFDVRPSYMQYEFQCRTVDNVELVVDVSLYWSIIDIEKMIMSTADAPGDVCTHARSKIIQSVSNKSLMEFLTDFNEIIRKGAGVDPQPDSVESFEHREVREAAIEDTRKATVALEAAQREFSEAEQSGDLDVKSAALAQLSVARSHLKTAARQQSIAERAHDPFYGSRGVDLISVEVLQFSCSNPETDVTLQEIIKETADRLKKEEFQKGENVVAMKKMEGDIELERKNKELIEIKKSHLIIESKIEGQAEAQKIKSYIEELTGQDPDSLKIGQGEAVDMFTMLRKMDTIKMLSEGKSSMYITPDDVNLSIGHLYPSQEGAANHTSRRK
eukprot:TRINITY_DN1276_c0_g2_i1.p1 TRINITY_DN1276_c0_g2~~TRINITY_DN1276_c0_g2_i1.p1  ORF type:complete len:437 (-),score=132.21 TRINITY_DN1276_c0_g2_i1:418-1728(-)